MARAVPGNAILVVMMAVCVVSTLGLVLLTGSGWWADFGTGLHQKEKRFQWAYGCLQTGVARAQRDFDRLLANQQTVQAQIDHDDWHALVKVEPVAGSMRVTCMLTREGNLMESLSARVVKDQKNHVQIQGFQR